MEGWLDEKKDGDREEGFNRYGLLESDESQLANVYCQI